MTKPTIVIEAPDLASYDRQYAVLEEKVRAADGKSIEARWEFGRTLDSERKKMGKQKLRKGRPEEISSNNGISLSELGYRLAFASRCDTKTKFSKVLENHKTWWDVIGWLDGRPPVTHNRGDDSYEWYTPSEFVEAARNTMGRIELDPASCKEANKTVKADKFYTKEDDGLEMPWKGKVWLNPPYGEHVGKFVARFVEAFKKGDIEEGVLLINGASFDADWFQPLWKGTLCFMNGRINFSGSEGTSPTHGSAFVYFGPNATKFREEFKQYGAVVKEWA